MAKYKDMTYTIRKDGRLMRRVSVNGKLLSIYSNDLNDLYKQFLELRYSDLKGSYVQSYNFKAYSEKWLKFNSSGKSEATIKEYKYIINKYLIPYFGYMNLTKIKRMDIQTLQTDLLNENHIELAHKCIRFMKTICNDAIADNYLIKNPCLGIKEPKIIHKEKEILTKEQDKLLLKSKHKYASFFRILRYTGMRREEITALTPDDIDLKNKTISINKAVSFASNQPKLKETKNKKSRVIPILNLIYNDVASIVKHCEENNIKYLFTKQTDINSMLTQEAIRCMTNSFCNDVGFKFTPHQLRHSYCIMLYYSGIKIKETQSLMGHSSAKMVYDLYAHLDQQRENITNTINNYLSKKKAIKGVSKSVSTYRISKRNSIISKGM
ncbi:MAG: site-specific integrase [Clostridia bacterium]|nr:site-specific integrase [Clostridia bacterium]